MSTAAAAPRYGSDYNDGFAGVRVTEIGSAEALSWDALLLFSHGRYDEFRQMVQAVHGKATESAYQLGLGLARLDGDRARFDSLAMEYAVNFACEPPVWLAVHSAGRTGSVEGGVTIAPASLCDKDAADAALRMESPWPMCADLSQAAVFDTPGLARFNDALSGRIERGEHTTVSRSDAIAAGCRETLASNTADARECLRFLLNLLRLSGQRAQFEELARAHAALGGAEPWIDPPPAPPAPAAPALLGIDAGEQLSRIGFEFAKSVMKSADYTAAKTGRAPVVFDFLRTRNWSVFDISNLSACIRLIEGDQMRLRFVNVNEILGLLLRMFQVDKTVRITAPGVSE